MRAGVVTVSVTKFLDPTRKSLPIRKKGITDEYNAAKYDNGASYRLHRILYRVWYSFRSRFSRRKCQEITKGIVKYS